MKYYGMLTHSEIILAWPTGENGRYGLLSEDIDESVLTIARWKHRGSIPPAKWLKFINAAKKRKIEGVTLETLAAKHQIVKTGTAPAAAKELASAP